MKICFIQHRAYELFNPTVKTQFGGAEVQMYLHAKELAKNKDFDIRFIVADYGQPKIENIENVLLFKSSSFNENIWQQAISFFKIFRKTDADVYVQMTLTRFSFLIALLCRLKRKKFIYIISHDNDIDGRILKTNYLLQKLSLLVFLFSSKIVAQNIYQYELLKKYQITSEIIMSSLETNTSTSTNKEYHLWIARAESWKKPELFFKLAKLNPNEKFKMVCPPFSEVDTVYYKKIIEQSKGINNVEFIGNYIGFNQLDNLFLKAKTFINTSEKEGFPTTFIHACKNGIPILSLSINPNSLFNEHHIGFYCQNNENEMQLKFMELNNNKKTYDICVANCKEYFNAYHNISNNSDKLLQLILR